MSWQRVPQLTWHNPRARAPNGSGYYLNKLVTKGGTGATGYGTGGDLVSRFLEQGVYWDGLERTVTGSGRSKGWPKVGSHYIG